MGQTASRVPGSLSGFDGRRYVPGVDNESARHAGVGARVSFFYHLPVTLGRRVRMNVAGSCLVLSCRCHSDSDVRFVRSNKSVALFCISCLVCAWLASFLALSQGSCRSFLGCLCISCKGCWTSYISSQAYRHNHTHTYTIIHADAREDMHTYNRTILEGQVRKSLVLWGAIQIRM